MKYIFCESFGYPPKFHNSISFVIDLSEEEAKTIRDFLKENGDYDYGYLETTDRALFDKINDAANDAVLDCINEERVRLHKKKYEFDEIDWSSIYYDFYWPKDLLDGSV